MQAALAAAAAAAATAAAAAPPASGCISSRGLAFLSSADPSLARVSSDLYKYNCQIASNMHARPKHARVSVQLDS